MSLNRDLTVGKPGKVLLRFCLPLFASIIFQQLYNIADSFVAGKFIGNDALAAVGMTEFAGYEPHRLSGGQKQRVAIAGIIAMLPRCIIFDESTAMLDPIGRRDTVEMMEKLNREKGITVITITHYMDEAVRADRVIVMDNGRVLADGTPKQVYSDRELILSAGLELPQCATLVDRLRTAGVNIPDGDSTTPEKCAELIASALKGGELS